MEEIKFRRKGVLHTNTEMLAETTLTINSIYSMTEEQWKYTVDTKCMTNGGRALLYLVAVLSPSFMFPKVKIKNQKKQNRLEIYLQIP